MEQNTNKEKEGTNWSTTLKSEEQKWKVAVSGSQSEKS